MSLLIVILCGFIGCFIAESIIYPLFKFWPLLLGFACGIVAGIILFVLYVWIVSLFAWRRRGKNTPFHLGTSVVYDFCSVALALSRGTVKVLGREKLPKGGYLLVMNHQSNLDVMCVLAEWRDRDLTFVMKNNLARAPLLGRLLVGSGFISLDRSNARDGVRMIEEASKRIKSGYPVAICPEGTRTKTPEMLPFHWGSFKIAFHSRAPIVLVAADGFWRMHEATPFFKKTVLKIVEVIPYEKYRTMTSQLLADYCARRIAIAQEKLRQEYPFLKVTPREKKKLQKESKPQTSLH